MKYLSSDPNIMSGDLVIKGTRIPIATIFHRMKDGHPLAEIHDMYRWVDMDILKGAIDEAIDLRFHAHTQAHA
ncbi:DUF433 domain-containing protein [Streptomyces sp. NPDC101206]|uniref:DUF433 domain-containing protein n=1 Tax=Streptomyces sp. NPDC101206 TaxID=3366128 RepID=UPI00381111EB